MTLGEVAAPEVVELDLSFNNMRSLAAVGAAVGAGALAATRFARRSSSASRGAHARSPAGHCMHPRSCAYK